MKTKGLIVAVLISVLFIEFAILQGGSACSNDANMNQVSLFDVKVAVQYRYVTDGKVINRSIDDVIKILKEVGADFIFQGWMTQWPCPDKCSDMPPEYLERCNLVCYSYEHLREAISKIKKELPNIIFCGGTQAEFLYPKEAGKSYLILEPGDRDLAWEMALDPTKWGINVSKRDFQYFWARRWGDIKEKNPSEEYLKQKMVKYFPDLTNPDFQKIFLNRIYKQIDAGVDAIWIDMLYTQGYLMEKLTGDRNHPAVRESYKAAWDIVNKIHEYGERKGKHIYVITWVAARCNGSLITAPKEYVNIDAAMVGPSPDEIRDPVTGKIGNFDEETWDKLIKTIKEEYGIPIFARIDYGGRGRTPLYVFSQELNKHEAREFLRKADEFFSRKGVIFIYPLHGGDMGRYDWVRKLSYGKFNWYDALAPEFETYETIKELAQSKKLKKQSLSDVKVAIIYERIGDGKWINRSVEDEIRIFKETGADFILRAFWRWSPCPEKCEELPNEKLRRLCELKGYSYAHLEETISKIKSEIPDIIICGAIPAQIIQRDIVWNPKTKEKIIYPETWDLALDPTKWGINVTKEEFQCKFAKTHLWVPRDLDCEDYSPEIASAYFPDITNPKFQELLLSWAERQIDAGVDAIWIDMLFKQAIMFYKLTKDPNHPAVRESYEAACYIVDRIHEYGEAKGKYIFVGSWATAVIFPYTPPNFDFITLSPSSKEVREMKFNEEKWNALLELIQSKFEDIPIFVFIDWGATNATPLGQFSQVLTKEQQRKFLRIADQFCSSKNMIFAYPVHGGFMGVDATILSFGMSRVYDSLAPEFETYETIKELAQSKKLLEEPDMHMEEGKNNMFFILLATSLIALVIVTVIIAVKKTMARGKEHKK